MTETDGDESNYVVLQEQDLPEVAHLHPKREGSREPNKAREPYPGMSPTQLNNLIVSYIYGPLAHQYDIISGTVTVQGQPTHRGGGRTKDRGSSSVHVDYLILKPKNNASSGGLPTGSIKVIFQATKDAESTDGPKNLASIKDLLKAVHTMGDSLGQGLDLSSATYVFPMAMCRLLRRHWRVVESNKPGEYLLHDSQSKMSGLLYPNRLKDKEVLKLGCDIASREHPRKVKVNYYCQQEQNKNDCGLYAYRYVKAILDSENPENFQRIKVSMDGDMNQTPMELLQSLIHENLGERLSELSEHAEGASAASVPRAKTLELGTPIPWRTEAFDAFISGNHVGVSVDDLTSLDDDDLLGSMGDETEESEDSFHESPYELSYTAGDSPRGWGFLELIRDLGARLVLFFQNLLGIGMQTGVHTMNQGAQEGAPEIGRVGEMTEPLSLTPSEPPSFSGCKLRFSVGSSPGVGVSRQVDAGPTVDLQIPGSGSPSVSGSSELVVSALSHTSFFRRDDATCSHESDPAQEEDIKQELEARKLAILPPQILPH